MFDSFEQKKSINCLIKLREQKHYCRSKKLTKKSKNKKKTRIIKKIIENYNCKRCRNFVKFENNFKFH